MNQNLAALLRLQDCDVTVSELESQLAELDQRVKELDSQLGALRQEELRAGQLLAEGERDEHEFQTRLEEQKALHDKSVSQLDVVRKPREAAAAMTQAEVTRRFLEDMERETQAAVAKVVDLRARHSEVTGRLRALEETQAEARNAIREQAAAIDGEMLAAREKRGTATGEVPRSLLARYEKLYTRRSEQSVFALLGSSCGNCDMALPIQRRNMMTSSGAIEACEACGVLLYVAE